MIIKNYLEHLKFPIQVSFPVMDKQNTNITTALLVF